MKRTYNGISESTLQFIFNQFCFFLTKAGEPLKSKDKERNSSYIIFEATFLPVDKIRIIVRVDQYNSAIGIREEAGINFELFHGILKILLGGLKCEVETGELTVGNLGDNIEKMSLDIRKAAVLLRLLISYRTEAILAAENKVKEERNKMEIALSKIISGECQSIANSIVDCIKST